MDLKDKRILVAGAGQLGSRMARALNHAGARVAVTSRDPAVIAELAGELGSEPIELEITDADSREAALDSAERMLGGIDGLVVATGAVAFGTVGEIEGEVEERLMAVNAVGPMRLLASASTRIADGGAVVVISAVVADFPTAGMASYSASKAALSAYLTAFRREQRKRFASILEVRPGHMETGFADRGLAGELPKMPEPEDPDELVAAVIEAIEAGKRQLAYDPMKRTLNAS